jgi:hypothetical protein
MLDRAANLWSNQHSAQTDALPSTIMNAGTIALLFVIPAVIIVLAVILFFTTKEADE